TDLATACHVRLSRTPVAERCRVFEGDCNSLIDDVIREIPANSLTLAFIDPKGLDIRFATVAKLSKFRSDRAFLFPAAYDISRNIEVYRNNPNSKLDQLLGPDSNWRKRWEALEGHSPANERNLFSEIYKSQLQKHLGYTEFDDHS